MTPGSFIEAAIPNIRGTFSSNTEWYLPSNYPPTGVFTRESVSNYHPGDAEWGGDSLYTLDASRASSVYKNGCNTVQPPAYTVYYIIKVLQQVHYELALFFQVEAALLAASLSGGNADGKPEDGWTKLPNGLILQWGYSGGGVRFPIPFPNACISAVASTNRSDHGGGGYNHVYNLSRTGMSVVFDAPYVGYWFAIGY